MANTRPKDFSTTRTWPAADDYLGLDGTAGGTAKFLASNMFGVVGAALASAATVDLNTITGDFVDVTGTTTITSFGTSPLGRKVWLRFTGVLVITHSASLILPDALNITTVANSMGCFISLSTGWLCLTYRRQDAPPLAYASNAQVQTGTSTATAVSPGTLKPRENFIVSCVPGETGSHIVQANAVRWRMPYPFKISADGVRSSCNVAPAGAKLICDIKASGVSILSTLLSIDIGQFTSRTAAVPVVISDFDLIDDEAMAVDITTIGSTTPGQGLKVTITGNRV